MSSRRRRRLIAGLLGVAALAGSIGWYAFGAGGDAGDEAADDTAELARASVERRDLVESETFDGSLGYADERALTAGRTGTLTAIADEGASLRRGSVLYEVDEYPIVLLLGELPAYRTLSFGVEGRDVRQLQRNLLALGFDDDGDLEVTGEFDSDTAEAVRDWQEALGVERTGTVQLGDAVLFPTPRRMGSHTLETGQGVAAGATIAATTLPAQIVTLDLEASDQDLVERGDRVDVELPNGERVAGRIEDVATVAESDPDDPSAEPTVEVTIRLLGEVRTELDEAPVDVDIETSRAEGVLTVPVQALLALAEGGYALEVVDGAGATHLVGVDTGDFADGFVEVSGDAIVEGVEVVTAS